MDPDDAMQIIAHRGCAAQYPENTIYAVERAAPHVDVVEIDVRRCGSGELVVFHDDRLDRLTDGAGLVAETAWSELRSLRVAGSNHGIPRLEGLLEAVPNGIDLDIELKEQGVVADVLELVGSIDQSVTVTANDPAIVDELVEIGASHPRGFIFWDDPQDGLEVATRYECDLIVPEATLCLETDLIQRAHAAGLAAWVWTVDDRATANQLRQAGADGLIVDLWDIV